MVKYQKIILLQQYVVYFNFFSQITQEIMKCMCYTVEASRAANAYESPCLNRNMNFSMRWNTWMLYICDSPLLIPNYSTC